MTSNDALGLILSKLTEIDSKIVNVQGNVEELRDRVSTLENTSKTTPTGSPQFTRPFTSPPFASPTGRPAPYFFSSPTSRSVDDKTLELLKVIVKELPTLEKENSKSMFGIIFI
jgi:hypothetical protein